MAHIEVELYFPARLFERTMEAIEENHGVNGIGDVYLAGNFNDWCSNTKKGKNGKICVDEGIRMTREDGYYIAQFEVEGPMLLICKPVVLIAGLDPDGFALVSYVDHPQGETIEGFRIDHKKPERGNFEVNVS